MVRHSTRDIGYLGQSKEDDSPNDEGTVIVEKHFSAEDLTEFDRSIVKHLLGQTACPIPPGHLKQPTHCPYCSSSALIHVEGETEKYVVVGRFQKVTDGRDIMCLHCHRVFVISLSGWG